MTRVLIAHIVGRARSVFSSPSLVAALLVCALISAFFWPSLTPAGLAPWGLGIGDPGAHRQADESQLAIISLAVIGVLWIGFFPLLLGMVVRPKVTGGSRSCAIELGHPVLPIPTRLRIVLEALTVLAMIGAVRLPFVLWRNSLSGGGEYYPENIAGSFLLGALVLTPALFLVLGRSRSLEYMFLGATTMGVLICAAMPFGLLATPANLSLMMLPLGAAALWISGLGPPRTSISLNFLGTGQLSRPAMNPETRMRLDFVVRSMTVCLPFAAAEAAIMAVYASGLIGGTTFYLASTLVYSLLIGFVVLRPMGSAQAIAGVWGKAGYAPGDFARAFSVLPVRRELMLRTVWLHGIISSSILWLAVVLTGAFNTRIALGEALFFTDSDGRFIGEVVFPLLAMIPCAAGFLVEGAAGDRRMAFFTGALFVLTPQIMFIMLIAGARAAVAIPMMTFVALVGGLPAFRHFRVEQVTE